MSAEPREGGCGAGAPAMVARLKADVLSWYRAAGRDLPWRRTSDPYAVWLSETMLQQTRVETVIPYYERFLRELPTVGSLAEAPEEKVLALWSGLGYYRRARMLHAAAKRVTRSFGGKLPADAGELRALEGVGAYTAGAVASIAFGQRAPVVDGNVTRVLARLYAIEDDVKTASGQTRLWGLAEELAKNEEGDPGDWTQAVMELGATVCLPRTPKCEVCPIRGGCIARTRGITAELPRAARKTPPKTMNRIAIVLASRGRILLAKRRTEALFGGLWEPPATGGDLSAFALHLGIEPSALEPSGQIVHVLSHRLLHVEIVCGKLGRARRFPLPGPEYDAIEAVPWKLLSSRGLSSLTRKILKVANAGPRGLPYEIK